MKIICALLLALPSIALAGSCENVITYPDNGWNNGRMANFQVTFPQNVNGWEVVIEFDRDVYEILCWSTDVEWLSNRKYKIKSQNYNAAQSAGNSIDYVIQMSFSEWDAKPELTSATISGANLCGAYSGGSSGGNDSGNSEPAATTEYVPISTGDFDYGDAIKKSLLFYEAQRSGDLPSSQRVTWRKDSALNDKGNNGEDLTGGYYDAGDFVKFNFPLAGSMTILAWSGIDYEAGYEAANQLNYLREAVKWGTDYLIKCHTNTNELYGQVGNGGLDHAFWGRPEDMTMARPAYKIDASNPGSDLAGETAAALASASILFKDANPSYSSTLLTHAKQIFDLADNYRGKYSDAIPDAQIYYKSWGSYNDELAWAAAWLYLATDDNTYLTKAESFFNDIKDKTSQFSWEEKSLGALVLLAKITNEQKYKTPVQQFCLNMRQGQPEQSPKGLVFFSKWGSLRYAANGALICLQAADAGIDSADNIALAKSQIDYALGSTGRSFMVGFGVNPPVRPHHRSSSCPTTGSCGWPQASASGPNPQELTGALLGGPSAANDQFVDNREDYITNEVTLDYNAGFQATLAGLLVNLD